MGETDPLASLAMQALVGRTAEVAAFCCDSLPLGVGTLHCDSEFVQDMRYEFFLEQWRVRNWQVDSLWPNLLPACGALREPGRVKTTARARGLLDPPCQLIEVVEQVTLLVRVEAPRVSPSPFLRQLDKVGELTSHVEPAENLHSFLERVCC